MLFKIVANQNVPDVEQRSVVNKLETEKWKPSEIFWRMYVYKNQVFIKKCLQMG